MFDFISFLSSAIIPIMIMYIVGMGVLLKINVFDEFTKGAVDGLKTVINLMPTLIGLIVAVGMVRESGLLDFICSLMGRLVKVFNFPAELVPLSIIKMLSASAANGLLFDIFEEYGCDSYIGLAAGIIMCSTETMMYCISVYFSVTGVTKIRWTLSGGILAGISAIIASVLIAQYIVY